MENIGTQWVASLHNQSQQDQDLIRGSHLREVQQSLEFEAQQIFEQWVADFIPKHSKEAMRNNESSFGMPIMPWHIATKAFNSFALELDRMGLTWNCVTSGEENITERKKENVVIMIMPAT